MDAVNVAERKAQIVIVDDHPAVKEALAIRIRSQPDLEVCGEASDEAHALQVIRDTCPDVVVVDIALKSGNGIDLLRRAKDLDINAGFIVWSMFQEELYASKALQAGAMAYLTKEQGTGQIIDAIRHILGGRMYLSPWLTQKLVMQVVNAPGRFRGKFLMKALSKRELEVLRLIGMATRNQDIATQLHLSIKTVETYRERIKAKLALDDGTVLNRYAVQWLADNP